MGQKVKISGENFVEGEFENCFGRSKGEAVCRIDVRSRFISILAQKS